MDTMQTPNDALPFPQCFQKGLASRQIQNRCFQTIWDQESRQMQNSVGANETYTSSKIRI